MYATPDNTFKMSTKSYVCRRVKLTVHEDLAVGLSCKVGALNLKTGSQVGESLNKPRR